MRGILSIFRNRTVRLGALVVALLSATAVGTVWLYGSMESIPSGVTVSGWEAGGLSWDRFRGELDARLDRLAAREVVLESSQASVPGRTATLGELGAGTNAEALIEKLGAYREGRFWKRAWTRWNMRGQTYALTALVTDQPLGAAVERIWRDTESKQPVPARRIVTSGDRIEYVREVPVAKIDRVKLKAEVNRAANADVFSVEPLRLRLPIYVQLPQDTVASLKAQGIERKIIEFSTPLRNSSDGRRHNISETAETIQDMVLKPGEVFSYEQVVQRTRQRVGYRNAPVILNGKIVPGVGGGICQVSTTLYNAVLRVGLEIVERRNHSLPISYAPMGQDATFSTGYIDFQFRNSMDTHLLIRTEVRNNRLYVKLFGSMPKNVRYAIHSEVVETIPSPVKVAHNPTLAKGAEIVLQRGKPGYVVVTTRTKYVDGRKAGTEQISMDRYQPKPTLVARNASGQIRDDSSNGQRPILEDGVEGPSFD